ncbi:hypothetical protein SAMN05444166_3628 [Singulisphaera sp. GP187]|uniref:hypothetical protein n=1 Tax=Singulisphaera sp. GP187 TaxID=1882752 RepID=UPI000926CA6D|nr:hypothetical protein [Singulisphaera sp. GP187]SIO30381.1 hypothetical protein SAMN05444166_3628 [Singulisphaera sp. GP187]
MTILDSFGSETTIANRIARPVEIGYEQAVYGSFPFWDRGYSILAHSPGCRPEWLVGLRAACQHFGERPAGASEASALFALPLEAGPWLIVGVSPQGEDDRGRPGALAFHALFLDPHDYRRAGGNPFDFASLLRQDWTADTETLPSGVRTVEPGELSPPPVSSLAESIATALGRGGRVALQAPAPIDALAQEVWSVLPLAIRCRASVATWAFGNGNQFDLIALPRLAGVGFDSSYVDLSQVEANPEGRAADRQIGHWGTVLKRAMPILGLTALLVGAALGIVLRPDHDEPAPTANKVVTAPLPLPLDRPPPDAADYPAEALDPEEKRRVIEGLINLAEQFGMRSADVPTRDDPATLMTALASQLRYRGPWLSSTELAEFEDEARPGSSHDRTLAREWHLRTRRFAPDRALPAHFRDGPLRWQLDTLTWSFHLDDEPNAHRRSPAEIPHALANALALDVSLNETPLVASHPALAAYRKFLDRLPRR